MMDTSQSVAILIATDNFRKLCGHMREAPAGAGCILNTEQKQVTSGHNPREKWWEMLTAIGSGKAVGFMAHGAPWQDPRHLATDL